MTDTFAVGDRVRFLRRYWITDPRATDYGAGTVTSIEANGDVLVRPDGNTRSKRFHGLLLADLEPINA